MGRCKEEEKEARRSRTNDRRPHGRRRRRGGGPGGGGAAWRQVGGDAGGIGRGPVEEEGPGKVGGGGSWECVQLDSLFLFVLGEGADPGRQGRCVDWGRLWMDSWKVGGQVGLVGA
jgi:hypothetical protein